MPPVDRRNPVRAHSSESRFSIMEFKRQFPDDDACLQWLWQKRYAPDGHTATCPKCLQPRRFHRLKKQPAYSCDSCGHHLHPTAGTIFHKSSTALWLWFYAMYLMTSTRCGLSAKQLERQIGVTYKTAWRMLNLIRNELMHDEGDSPLAGLVEIDETSVEGRPKARMNRREAAQRRERDSSHRVGDGRASRPCQAPGPSFAARRAANEHRPGTRHTRGRRLYRRMACLQLRVPRVRRPQHHPSF